MFNREKIAQKCPKQPKIFKERSFSPISQKSTNRIQLYYYQLNVSKRVE